MNESAWDLALDDGVQDLIEQVAEFEGETYGEVDDLVQDLTREVANSPTLWPLARDAIAGRGAFLLDALWEITAPSPNGEQSPL